MTFNELRQNALEHFKHNPLLSSGIAAGAGFVLGGGLATRSPLRLVRKTIALAFQMAIVPALLSRLRDAIVDETNDVHST